MTRRAAAEILCMLALLSVTLAVYAQTFGFDFVHWDDPVYVRDNPHIREGITAAGVRWAFTTGYASNWHPLTWLSLMVDVSMFGIYPGGHHVINVLGHLLATVLLYAAMRRITARPWASLMIAALFALHPLHVESVAWVSQRKDVLAAVFGHATLWAYAVYVARRTPTRYVAVTLLLAIGLMSKPTLVTLPAVLVLIDYWLRGRDEIDVIPRASWRSLILEKLPWLALACAASFVTFYVQQAGGATATQATIALPARLANAAVAYVQYLAKTFYPADLTYLYTHPDLPGGTALSSGQIIGAVIVLLAMTVGAILARRRDVQVGWLWFLGMLVPMIGLVQVGTQAFADRYTYLPLTGLFIMIVFAGDALLRRAVSMRHMRHTIAGVTVGAALMACGVLSFIQIGNWRDGRALVEHALRVTPRDPVVLQAAGVMRQPRTATSRTADWQRSIDAYAKAVDIDPNFAEAHNSLGVALQITGRLEDAIASYRAAIAAQPTHIRARYHLGRALLQLPRDRDDTHAREALEHLRIAAAQPMTTMIDAQLLADIEHNLGDALWRLGRTTEARQAYTRSLTYTPGDAAVMRKIKSLQ